MVMLWPYDVHGGVVNSCGVSQIDCLCNSRGELPNDHLNVTCLLEIWRSIYQRIFFYCFSIINIIDFKEDLRETVFLWSIDNDTE